MFETAAKYKFRFNSSRGALTTEQLWDVPLLDKNGFSLNAIAKDINATLRESEEVNFVNVTQTQASTLLQTKLEIVKHIIADKQAANAKLRESAAVAEKRNKLLAVLAEKQDEALKTMTVEEINASLAALN
jgi:hypothetical protein